MSAARPALRVLLGNGDAQSAGTNSFTFDGRLYRGTFSRLDDGQIVNLVDLEQYLASVVPAEMSPRWPAAALQAQAICARTYVLQRSDPRRPYDLVPSEADQVYRGVAGESPGANESIFATAGQVLRYNGGFAHVAYSSCCGGHTEAGFEAWGGAPIPYLNGVLCTWCEPSPYFRWTTSLELDTIAAAFAQPLAAVGPLQDLSIAERDASGRARNMALHARAGTVIVAGTDFRRSIGPRVLRSLLITNLGRSADGTSFTVAGGGLGHGVGLCQWGARGMGAGAATAAQILSYYFPGTSVDELGR